MELYADTKRSSATAGTALRIMNLAAPSFLIGPMTLYQPGIPSLVKLTR